MKSLFLCAVGVLILVVVISLTITSGPDNNRRTVASGDTEGSQPTAEMQSVSSRHPAPPEVAPIRVSAMELQSDYEQNEVLADSKYKKRRLLVSGYVGEIRKDFMGEAVVELSSFNSYRSVAARLSAGEEGKAAQLRIGMTVAVLCTGEGFIVGDAQLNDCTFQDEPTRPVAPSNDTEKPSTPLLPMKIASDNNPEWSPAMLPNEISNALAMPPIIVQGNFATIKLNRSMPTTQKVMRIGDNWTIFQGDDDNPLLRSSGLLHTVRRETNGYDDLLVEYPMRLELYSYNGEKYSPLACYVRDKADIASAISKVSC